MDLSKVVARRRGNIEVHSLTEGTHKAPAFALFHGIVLFPNADVLTKGVRTIGKLLVSIGTAYVKHRLQWKR